MGHSKTIERKIDALLELLDDRLANGNPPGLISEDEYLEKRTASESVEDWQIRRENLLTAFDCGWNAALRKAELFTLCELTHLKI